MIIEREGEEPVVVNPTPQPQPQPTPKPGQQRRTPSATIVDADAEEPRPSTRQTLAPESPRPRKTVPDAPVPPQAPPKVSQQATLGPTDPTSSPLSSSTPSTLMFGRLGGYELKRRLGAGGMGTVYLARQVSLDRDVAVKVLDATLSQDAQFVARFTREAFAAAQLVHHNVVQIHDIGEEQQTHFFSMEYVKGQSLADLVRTEGAVAPDIAAGYVLQAARGLKLAHDQGMVHRDIKPENLLLSAEGVVKVADLGLVKREQDPSEPARPARRGPRPAMPSFGETEAHSSMGTPAYMAPEQAADASSVDARADIYSLGCTLFTLLTGKPPFEGDNAAQVIAAAAEGEVPSPLRFNRHIPSELGRITRKMTARRKESRYPNTAMLIRDLENYLGVESAGTFVPRQQHINELERCVKQYHDSNLATIRKVLYGGTGLLALVIVSAFGWGKHWWWAAAGMGLVTCTFLIYQLLVELSGRRYFLGRLRQAVKTFTWREWTRVIVAAVLLLLAVFAMGIVLNTLGIVILSLVLACTARITLDRMVTRQRHGSFAQAEAMLRGFRVQGLDEEAIRRFVCEYSGHYWEEFYEEMFGYEAKIEARRRWGRTIRGHLRPKFASWRDPIVEWINKRIEVRRAEKERRHLLNVQIKAFRAQGMDEIAAGKQAKRMTELMLAQAAEMREEILRSREETRPSDVPVEPAQLHAVQRPREVFNFEADTEKTPASTYSYRHSSYLARRYGGPFDWLLGPRLRFIAAAVLLVGFLLWRYENRDAIINELEQTQGARVDPTEQVDLSRAIITEHLTERREELPDQPLRIAIVPDWICDAAGSWNGGAAGAVLLVSTVLPGTWIAVPIYIAVVIMLGGHQLTIIHRLPTGDPKTASLLMGLGLALMTFAVSRREA